jgi:hypothetical protein
VPNEDSRLRLDVQLGGRTYPIGEGRLIQLRFFETSTYMAPMAELSLEDRGDWLTEIMPLTGTELVRLSIPDLVRKDGKQEMQEHSFRIHRAIATRSSSDSHLIKLYLISDVALPLLDRARFKSYASMKISDAVAAIASDVGLESEIEETDAQTFDMFCPGWNYAQMIAWLADRARSAKYQTCGYLYFIDRDGTLRFMSPESVKNQKPALTLTSKDMRDTSEYDEGDAVQGPYRAFYNSMQMGVQGALGVTGSWFSFEGAKFKEYPTTIDGSDEGESVTGGWTNYERSSVAGTQLQGTADRVSVRLAEVASRSVMLTCPVAVNAQSEEFERARAESVLLRAANSLVKFEVLTDGDLRVKAGTVVVLQVNSPLPQAMINQTFSGRWVVERVTHQLMPRFVTKMMLYRSGVGGYDGVALVQPPGGFVDVERR